jgi:hypothetical protein
LALLKVTIMIVWEWLQWQMLLSGLLNLKDLLDVKEYHDK